MELHSTATAPLFSQSDDPQQSTSNPHKPFVSNISITDLFGRYSYSIPDLTSPTSDYNRLILLYGENGTGKTTLLNLVYHMLSPGAKRNHRTYIARTPFRSLVITLGDLTELRADRHHGELTGSYVVTITTPHQMQFRFDLQVTDDAVHESKSLHSLISYLQQINANPYYLKDTREFSSDSLMEEDDTFIRSLNYPIHTIGSSLYYPGGEVIRNIESGSRTTRQEQALAFAINRTENWLVQQAFRSTNTGIDSANNVYLAMLNHLAQADTSQALQPQISAQSVANRLQALAQRTNRFAEFDLGSAFPAVQILNLLNQASHNQKQHLSAALAPHLNQVEAQLDALQQLLDLLVTFTTSANSFLKDKSIHVSAGLGDISIVSSEAHRLLPSQLSSGERQLLLLLCNTLIARENSKLFIIDEPEISLNITWQRKLLDVLLDLTSGTSLQFLIATHSIEMISGHRDSLARLVNADAS